MLDSALNGETKQQESGAAKLINDQLFAAVLSRFRQSPYLDQFRGFSEFTSKEYFSKPGSYDEVTTRLEMNIKYFAANYMLVGMLLLGYTMYEECVC